MGGPLFPPWEYTAVNAVDCMPDTGAGALGAVSSARSACCVSVLVFAANSAMCFAETNSNCFRVYLLVSDEVVLLIFGVY